MLPLRNQGFADDFAYAQSVRHLVNVGEIKVSEWTAPTAIFHIVWGYLFVKILGFSFSSLHLSIILLLPILLVYIFLILAKMKIQINKCLIFTLFFLSVPWIIQLSFTFMTDIPFLTFETIAIYYYLEGLKSKNESLLVGSFAASIAFLIRQIGIVLPISVFLVLLIKNKANYKYSAKLLMMAIFFPILTFILYSLWLKSNNETVTQIYYQKQTLEILGRLNPLDSDSFLNQIIQLFHKSLNYISQLMGLFAPLFFLLIISNLKYVNSAVKKHKRLIVLLTLTSFALYITDYVLYKQGFTVGYPAESLFEYDYFLPFSLEKLWTIAVFFSIPIWSTLIIVSIKSIKFSKNKSEGLFLLLCFIGMFVLTIFAFYSWGEYVIPFLPFILIWVSKVTYKLKINPEIGLLIIFLLILNSLQIAKIRYDENGIAWQKAISLVNNGLSYSEVNPNYNMAWVGWFNFEDTVASQIQSVKGDKSKINFPISFNTNQKAKNIIASERKIKLVGQTGQNKFQDGTEIRSLLIKWKLFTIN